MSWVSIFVKIMIVTKFHSISFKKFPTPFQHFLMSSFILSKNSTVKCHRGCCCYDYHSNAFETIFFHFYVMTTSRWNLIISQRPHLHSHILKALCVCVCAWWPEIFYLRLFSKRSSFFSLLRSNKIIEFMIFKWVESCCKICSSPHVPTIFWLPLNFSHKTTLLTIFQYKNYSHSVTFIILWLSEASGGRKKWNFCHMPANEVWDDRSHRNNSKSLTNWTVLLIHREY